MQQFCGILLNVYTRKADTAFFTLMIELNQTVFAKRQVGLGNLITLGKVGIKIIFAVMFGYSIYFASCGKTDF
jgi:hypothetical protein